MQALDPHRYDVLSIGIRPDGTWVPGETDPSKLDLSRGLVEVEPSDQRIVIPPGTEINRSLKCLLTAAMCVRWARLTLRSCPARAFR